MSLREARQIAKWARKSGQFISAEPYMNRAACDLHNPGRHRFSGDYTVATTRNMGAYVAACYLWSKGLDGLESVSMQKPA